jgi:aspartate kinase
MVVMKFGSTSVADRTAMARVIAIVRAQRQADIARHGELARGPIVVVSALGGATDRFLGAAAEAAAGDIEGVARTLESLRARHIEVAGIITDASLRAQVLSFIEQEFDALERVVNALAVLREVSPRWLDTIAATGEIVSSRIVAAAFTSQGLPADWVDARRAMVTTAEFTAAPPLFPETTAALTREMLPTLEAGRIAVMGGFVAATADGITTTLGRGGSDYSASIVGSCVGANEIQIWTDVDGMLTADPRLVSSPLVVPRLSFAEASELAYFGAKVLHPATIQPAVARSIPVKILNSHRPQAAGTTITAERPPSGRPVTAIASKKHVSVVDITSTRMLMAHGFLRRLFEVFERFKTPVDVVTTSEVSVSVTIDDRRRLPDIIEALAEFADVSCEHDMSIVCVVGEGLHTDPSLVGKVMTAVGDIPIRLVSQAASRRNLTFVIREADLPETLARVHAAFFAPAAPAMETV